MKPLGWLPVILQRALISPITTSSSLFPRRPVSLPTFPTPPTQPRPPRIPEQVEIAFKGSTTTKKKSLLEMLLSSKGKSDLAVKPFASSAKQKTMATTTPQITYTLDNDVLRIVARIGKQTYIASIHGWSNYYRPTIPRNTLLSVEEQAVQEYIAQAIQQSIAEITHRAHVVASQTVPALRDLESASHIIEYSPTTTETPEQEQELEVTGHETTLTIQHAERAGAPEPHVDAAPPHPKPVVLFQAASLAAQQTTAHQESVELPLTTSSLSAELISKISKLSTRLEREIKSHWPYPNKELKQYKMTGLNELIELAKTCSVQDALAQIENKYPKIKDGRMSTRTADLLDEIARFGQQNVLPMPG
jgi:hypothetical protein